MVLHLRRLAGSNATTRLAPPCRRVPPGYVSHLGHYWDWFQKYLDECGGWVEGDYLIAELLFDGREGFTGLWVAPRQSLVFAEGWVLEFDFVLNSALHLENYRFSLHAPDGTFMWRKEKHPGHEEALGAPSHIHRGPDPDADPESYQEVDLEEAVEEVYEAL